MRARGTTSSMTRTLMRIAHFSGFAHGGWLAPLLDEASGRRCSSMPRRWTPSSSGAGPTRCSPTTGRLPLRRSPSPGCSTGRPGGAGGRATVGVVRVAVVGAGIGGLTAALCLAAAGIADVTVYERSDELHEIGAGIQLSPNGTRILHGLGLGDALGAVAVRPAHRRHAALGGLVAAVDEPAR